MTAEEMKIAFLIGYDTIAGNIAPGYENEEISFFLTQAEEDVTTDYADQYEKGEMIRKKLDSLIVNSLAMSPYTYDGSNDIENSFYYEVPDKVLKVVRERFVALSSDKCINGKAIKVVPVRQDEVEANHLRNPFYTPDENMVWRLDAYDEPNNKKMHQIIIGDTYTILDYGYMYIKHPAGIVVDDTTPQNSELDELLHQEVVDTAVRIATAATRPQLYQVAVNEEQLNSELNKN